MNRAMIVVALLAAASDSCPAQSINIDFGLPGAGPSSRYGGAGLPGVWNSIEGTHTPFASPEIIYGLVDLEGNPTDVTLYQYGGTELLLASDPTVSGDDAVLLNDAIITHFPTLETCLFINGLDPGWYEVITYAWRPDHPEFMSKVRYDFTPGQILVGGPWSGRHVEGVTYARQFVSVAPTGFMGGHSGNLPRAELSVGAAMNGVQLRKLDPADFNHDGVVNGIDLAMLLGAWTGAASYVPCPPLGLFDLNGDCKVNGIDLATLLGAWG